MTDEIGQRRRRRGPRVPAAVVIDERNPFLWWHDANGKPFTEATARAFAELLNSTARPGQRACQAYALTPVTAGNDGRGTPASEDDQP